MIGDPSELLADGGDVPLAPVLNEGEYEYDHEYGAGGDRNALDELPDTVGRENVPLELVTGEPDEALAMEEEAPEEVTCGKGPVPVAVIE